jgi:hypothetical protein
MSGSAKWAIRMNDQHETSMVFKKAVPLDIHDTSVQGLPGREGDRMQHEVEPSPFFLETLEHLLHLAFGVDVQRHEDRGVQRPRERLDVLLRPVVQVGDSKIGAQRSKRLGATPGDRLIVGDADDEAFFPLHRNFGIRKDGDIHDTLSRLGPGDDLLISSVRVCCAIINSSSVGMT